MHLVVFEHYSTLQSHGANIAPMSRRRMSLFAMRIVLQRKTYHWHSALRVHVRWAWTCVQEACLQIFIFEGTKMKLSSVYGANNPHIGTTLVHIHNVSAEQKRWTYLEENYVFNWKFSNKVSFERFSRFAILALGEDLQHGRKKKARQIVSHTKARGKNKAGRLDKEAQYKNGLLCMRLWRTESRCMLECDTVPLLASTWGTYLTTAFERMKKQNAYWIHGCKQNLSQAQFSNALKLTLKI